MQECEQTEGMSVLEHGEMVHEFYKDLEAHILKSKPLKHDWRLPAWIYEPALWDARLSDNTVQMYQIFHDCGKVVCREVDQDGKAHFPNHAQASARTWLEVGGCAIEARLMGMDMDIHLLKAEGLPEFCARPESATLLLTGLCEIHANASMFGGIESNSFKMKWKNIDRRGKQIAAHLAQLH
jgi:hypothetical protein